MKWADGGWASPFLDRIIPYVTHLGSQFAVVVFILICWLVTRRGRVAGCLFLLYGVESGILYGVKFLVHRQRPLAFFDFTARLSRSPGEILDPSFPSGHALYAFMIAAILATWFPRYRLVFYVAAAFIGWTRIYLGLHYPTDVVAGALLGYGLTRLFVRWAGSRIPRPRQPL